MDTTAQWVQYYLSRNWSLFPVRIAPRKGKRVDKIPLVEWGRYQERLPTTEEIAQWFSRWPAAGIGIVTGSISNLVVLDIDPNRGGVETMRRLIQDGVLLRGDLRTPSVSTQSGGVHLYFRHPGGRVPNAVDLWPGIDLRGDGGFVVAPPTIVPDTDRGWRWRTGPA